MPRAAKERTARDGRSTKAALATALASAVFTAVMLIAACGGETAGTTTVTASADSASTSTAEPAADLAAGRTTTMATRTDPTTTNTTAALEAATASAGGPPATTERSITVTVVYDNTVAPRPDLQTDLRSDWGFACVVETSGATVLFDTGKSSDILLENLDALDIDPATIDIVVLSHAHSDHTGGLSTLLEHADAAVIVYRPGATSDPVEIAAGLVVTGPLGDNAGGGVVEQALIVETAAGPLLLTGCAHPGIVRMVESATEIAGAPIRTVLGGFHLSGAPAGEVETIALRLTELGVVRCGPAHCTGDRATAVLKKAFGAGFVPMGVGAVIAFPDS